MNILTYSSGLTRVVTGSIMLEADERPELPFPFDALYYEPPTALTIKVLAGEQVLLSAAEIAACEAYCEAFLDTADYHVFGMDEAGIFAGTMLKSEAQRKNLLFRVTEAPDHPASKWDGASWQRVAAAILEDGSVRLMPDGLCALCAVALSADEWAEWPAMPVSDEDEDWRWDFAAEIWRDVSDPYVYAYDEVGAFVGSHKRSALREGWGYTRQAPEVQASVMTPEGWRPVVAGINDDGTVELRPAVIRDEVILLFTRDEWARWPERPAAAQGEFWCWDFVSEQWRDMSNRYGAAFEVDGERIGVFVDTMGRMDAEREGLGWTMSLPDHPASKWDGASWQRLVVVIMDDGRLRHNPDSVCQRCMLAFTAEEWAAWPQPEREIPADLGGWFWNFSLERWEDRRPFEDLQKQASQAVRSVLYWDMRENLEPGIFEELSLFAGRNAVFTDALATAAGQDWQALEPVLNRELSGMAGLCGQCAGHIRAAQAAIAAATDNPGIDAAFVAATASRRNRG